MQRSSAELVLGQVLHFALTNLQLCDATKGRVFVINFNKKGCKMFICMFK